MQLFTLGGLSKIICTLGESVSLENPFFLFVFEYPDGETVKVVIDSQDDQTEPAFRWRRNEFLIDTDLLFSGKPCGIWHYKVYEQADKDNQDPYASIGLIERGILQLVAGRSKKATTQAYEPEAYKNRTVYNG